MTRADITRAAMPRADTTSGTTTGFAGRTSIVTGGGRVAAG